MRTYTTVYFGAALVAMFAMPLVVRLAKAVGLMDQPGLRKVHADPVARIGGLAIVGGFFALTVPVLLVDNAIGHAVRSVQVELLALMAGAAVMFVTGFVDDVRGVRAGVKLLAMLAASALVCAAGARVQDINFGAWGRIELGVLAWPVTMAWIATVTIGINLIDGLDGLAGGVAAIVCGTIGVFALWSGQVVMAVLMLGLLGSLTGFLFFNYHPAKVFMGDGGSMFIGFTIGAGSVLCQTKTSTFVGIALPMLALGVPILDIFFTMIRRGIIDRRSIFAPDGGHLHHRLLARGLRHETVVFVVYGVTLVSAGFGLATLMMREGWAILMFGLGLAFLFVTFALVGSARLGETLRALRRNRSIAKQARVERGYFEDAQLRLREAASFTDWWQAVCIMANCLKFRSLALWRWDQGVRAGRLVWRTPHEEVEGNTWVDVSLPVARGPMSGAWQLRVRINVHGFLEAAGWRVGLLARLIDEHPPPVENGQVSLVQPTETPIDAAIDAPVASPHSSDGGLAAAR